MKSTIKNFIFGIRRLVVAFLIICLIFVPMILLFSDGSLLLALFFIIIDLACIAMLMPVTFINMVKRDIENMKEKRQEKDLDVEQEPVCTYCKELEPEIKSYNQFVEDTKRQIEKETGFDIFWPKGTNVSISKKENFTAYIDNAIKRTPFTVYMNNFGVDKICFLDGWRKDILFNKTKKQESQYATQDQKHHGEVNLNNLPKNLYIDKDGDLGIKPDYSMLARDWFNKNLNFINKKYEESKLLNSEEDIYKIHLQKRSLPTDKETWKEIGKIIKNQIGNGSYYVNPNGLTIKFKKRG